MRRSAVFLVVLAAGSGFAAAANSQWEESRRNGAAAREQNRYAEARRWLETALVQAAFDDADLRRADLDDEIAGVCQVIGDAAEADRLYNDALKVLEKHPNDGAEVRSVVLAGLGLFRARQGRLTEANDALERALASAETAFAGRDPRLASVQSNLGQIDVMQGKVAEAEALLKSAIAIQKASPATPASERIISEASLGTLYMTEGRYSEAEAILGHANEEASALPKPYPAWAGTMSALADLYRLEGNSSRTGPLLKKAQAIYEAAFGPDSPRVAEILLDRSIDTIAARKSALAESEINRALEILRKADGPEHPAVALAEFRLAQTYTQEGRYAEAESLLRHVAPIQEKAYPGGHFLVGDCLLQLAEVERLQQHYPDAEAQFRKAIAAYEKAGNSGSPGLAVALRQYAKLLRTSRGEEAKILEKRADGLQRSAYR